MARCKPALPLTAVKLTLIDYDLPAADRRLRPSLGFDTVIRRPINFLMQRPGRQHLALLGVENHQIGIIANQYLPFPGKTAQLSRRCAAGGHPLIGC